MDKDKDKKLDKALDKMLDKKTEEKTNKKDVKTSNELVEQVDKKLIFEDGRQLLV